jgi:hypothetical protein
MLQGSVLREALSRPIPGRTAIGLDVIRLARRLGRTEELLEGIQSMEQRFGFEPEQSTSRSIAQTFMRAYRVEIAAVPISALDDLRWFAGLCHDDRLTAQIQRIVGTPKPEYGQPTLFAGDETT